MRIDGHQVLRYAVDLSQALPDGFYVGVTGSEGGPAVLASARAEFVNLLLYARRPRLELGHLRVGIEAAAPREEGGDQQRQDDRRVVRNLAHDIVVVAPCEKGMLQFRLVMDGILRTLI